MVEIKTNQSKLFSDYATYIALSRYARWLPNEQRRETWYETVHRYIDFFDNRVPLDEDEWRDLADDLYLNIKNMEVVPSMRCLMTAGPALERDNIAGYNCSAHAITGRGEEISVWHDDFAKLGVDEPIKISLKHPIAFDESMYILLCGTGVGFSVERQFINHLPTVGKKLSRAIYKRNGDNFPGVPIDELSTFSRKTNCIYVADSKYGWASALRILIVELYNCNFDVQWDTSKIRAAGTPLKTFGGRASGPEPLERLFKFVVEIFKKSEGRKLTSVECHDICCKIAEVILVGGVRRSALLSLSNLTDERMRHAKSGQWWLGEGQRALSNNSVCYTEKPDIGIFMKEWQSLYESRSGERGIFNREAARRQAAKNGRRDAGQDYLTNPCSEILLRDRQMCNLSEAVVRTGDTFDDLKRKVRYAAILGTLQATLTDIRYLSPTWKKNMEEERLLGVSLTGIMDHEVLNGQSWGLAGDPLPETPYILREWLEKLKEVVIETNVEWSKKLGINPATATTCVKPSGTVSQLVDSASGIHPRYSPYYVRTVRSDVKDPITQFLRNQGVPGEVDVTNSSNWVFSFPIKAPKESVFRDERSAIQQLEHWLVYQDHWCEHKPSCTIYVKEHEWLEVGAWVYEHFDDVSGVSFLPHSDHAYAQAPYQEIDEETYNQLYSQMPGIDWSKLSEYESEDMTKGMQELACTGGACEL